MRHACPSSAPKPTCSICTSAPRRPGQRADSRARGRPLDLAGGQRTAPGWVMRPPLARDRMRPDDPESRVVLIAGTVWGIRWSEFDADSTGERTLDPGRSRLGDLGAAAGRRQPRMRGARVVRACHRDRHQYPPFDTSAGEASSEVAKVLDSSVPAGWSRMPFRPTGYFHPADGYGRNRRIAVHRHRCLARAHLVECSEVHTERGFIC